MAVNRVLVLGAGMVAGPLVKYFIENRIALTIASNTPERAKDLVGGNSIAEIVIWEATDTKLLDKMVKDHVIVVSLLPYTYHVQVAEFCLKHKKHLVTTSYISDAMKALHTKAKEAGLLFLNECGLDPGIDHMSAKRVIDTVKGLGGKIIEFYSITGALAAPESSKDNPFRYKFSWSPKGVIIAGNNSAEYLKDGKKVVVESKDLFKTTFDLTCPKVDVLDVYPNRNSLPYIELYELPDVKTMFRGTFRYKGWCKIMHAFKQLGLTSEKEYDFSKISYADFMSSLVKNGKDTEPKEKIANLLKVKVDDIIIEAIDYLGLFSNDKINREKNTAFELVSDLMIEKMMLGDNERDMSVMLHVFLAEYEGGKQEIIRSRLLEYGSVATETSIARTVALPAACAIKLILEGEIAATGVHLPVLPEIYNPILEELENLGIELIEEYGLPVSVNNIKL